MTRTAYPIDKWEIWYETEVDDPDCFKVVSGEQKTHGGELTVVTVYYKRRRGFHVELPAGHLSASGLDFVRCFLNVVAFKILSGEYPTHKRVVSAARAAIGVPDAASNIFAGHVRDFATANGID